MQFQEFQSLVNENPKNVGKILMDDRAQFAVGYATEKVHGANFGVWWEDDTQTIRFSKRTSFIGEEANFYNWQRFFTPEQIAHMERNFQAVCSTAGIKTITLYGELFGGDGVEGIKSVQREIRYGNDITFIGFQLIVDGKYITSYKQLADFCTMMKVPVVPLLAEGTLPELYAIDPDQPSVLSPEKDIREGIVITITDFPGMDHDAFDGKPLMLKKRSKDFIENKGVVSKTSKDFDAGLSAEIMQAVTIIKSMLTPQRVSNVNSHFGYEGGKNFSNLMTAVADDVLKEFRETHGDVSKEVVKHAKSCIGRTVPPLVRKELGL